MLGDQGEAEDVAQETFMRLMYKVADGRRGCRSLKTWLYRVAINLCIDRRRKNVPEPMAELPDVPEAGRRKRKSGSTKPARCARRWTGCRNASVR